MAHLHRLTYLQLVASHSIFNYLVGKVQEIPPHYGCNIYYCNRIVYTLLYRPQCVSLLSQMSFFSGNGIGVSWLWFAKGHASTIAFEYCRGISSKPFNSTLPTLCCARHLPRILWWKQEIASCS